MSKRELEHAAEAGRKLAQALFDDPTPGLSLSACKTLEGFVQRVDGSVVARCSHGDTPEFCGACAVATSEPDAAQLALALRNVRQLAKRMKRALARDADLTDALDLVREAPDHLLRFCAEAGIHDDILRGDEE